MCICDIVDLLIFLCRCHFSLHIFPLSVFPALGLLLSHYFVLPPSVGDTQGKTASETANETASETADETASETASETANETANETAVKTAGKTAGKQC